MDNDLHPSCNNNENANILNDLIEEPEPKKLKEEEEEFNNLNEDIEAEIIADTKSEEYNEEITGIKIKYSLTQNEIKKFVKISKTNEEHKKIQRKYIFIQSILFAVLVMMAYLSGSEWYFGLAIIPFISFLLMWSIPFINIKIISNKLLSKNDFIVHIFQDRLEIQNNNEEKTIYLNNDCQSLEHDGLIMIFNNKEPVLVIPLRAIDEDLRADVEAIITTRSNPRYEDNEQ